MIYFLIDEILEILTQNKQTEPSTYFLVEYVIYHICIEASVLLLLHLIK